MLGAVGMVPGVAFGALEEEEDGVNQEDQRRDQKGADFKRVGVGC